MNYKFFLILLALLPHVLCAQLKTEISLGSGINLPFYDAECFNRYPYYPGTNIVAEYSMQDKPGGIGLMLSLQQFYHRPSSLEKEIWNGEFKRDSVIYFNSFSSFYSLAVPLYLNLYDKKNIRVAIKGSLSFNRYDHSAQSRVRESGSTYIIEQSREYYFGILFGLSLTHKMNEHWSIKQEILYTGYAMIFGKDWNKMDYNFSVVYTL